MKKPCAKHPAGKLPDVTVTTDDGPHSLCGDCEWDRQYRLEKAQDRVRGMENDEP